MDGITVFTPAPGQPRYQMSVDCFSLIRDMIKQAAIGQVKQAVTEQIDDTAKDVARAILQDVENITATGQLSSVGDICDFLRDYYELDR